ncbi:hypothetical protein D9M71_254940 [compost metagenome]
MAARLSVLPDFSGVAGAVLGNGDGATLTLALVAIGPVAFTGLIDADLAVVMVDVFGGAVVVGTGLDTQGVVGSAADQLFDEGAVIVTVLHRSAGAAGLGVLVDEREVATAFLGLLGFVFGAQGLAGMGVVQRPGRLLFDLAAELEQLLGVTGVVFTGGALLDIAVATFLLGGVVVAQANLVLGGDTERGSGLFDLCDVFGTRLVLGRQAFIGNRLACKAQYDGGA